MRVTTCFVITVVVAIAVAEAATGSVKIYPCGHHSWHHRWFEARPPPPPCGQPVYSWVYDWSDGWHDWVTEAAYLEWQRWVAWAAPIRNTTASTLVPMHFDALRGDEWFQALKLCDEESGLTCQLDPLMKRWHKLRTFERYCQWCAASEPGVPDDFAECNKAGCRDILRKLAEVVAQLRGAEHGLFVMLTKRKKKGENSADSKP